MALANPRPAADQNRRIAEAIRELGPRIARFVRRRVSAEDVEDVLQDVFADLVEATRALTPIDELGAWLYRVARNRIIDRSRKKRPEQFPETLEAGSRWEDNLPSPDAAPDRALMQRLALEEIARAIEELPDEQRTIFIAHEIEGRSFKQIAAETGVGVNTLLSRKRYAVQFLRRRLRHAYDELLNF